MTDILIKKIKSYHQILEHKTRTLLDRRIDDDEPINDFYKQVETDLKKYNLHKLIISTDYLALKKISYSWIIDSIIQSNKSLLNQHLKTIFNELENMIKDY